MGLYSEDFIIRFGGGGYLYSETKVLVYYELFFLSFYQTPEGLFLKSNFEYLRQNFRKSIKLLNSAPKPNDIAERGQSVSTMYYNDLGCIHFQLHKYNLAAFYFRQALQENNRALSLLPLVDKSRFEIFCMNYHVCYT